MVTGTLLPSRAAAVGVTDALVMKRAFEARFWTLEEERTPSRTYLEKKLEQVEKNDLRAELLTEVLCQRDDGEEVLKPVWDTALSLKAVKVARKVAAPANPEQLRRRLATMGAAWAFVAAAHPSRPYLAGVGMQIWTEYWDYMLGRYVLGVLGGIDGAAKPCVPDIHRPVIKHKPTHTHLHSQSRPNCSTVWC